MSAVSGRDVTPYATRVALARQSRDVFSEAETQHIHVNYRPVSHICIA